jgi:hypothetical protein
MRLNLHFLNLLDLSIGQPCQLTLPTCHSVRDGGASIGPQQAGLDALQVSELTEELSQPARFVSLLRPVFPRYASSSSKCWQM